jgi:hypothetical protein
MMLRPEPPNSRTAEQPNRRTIEHSNAVGKVRVLEKLNTL